MSGVGYAGKASDWFDACAAAAQNAPGIAQVRTYFEHWFVPIEIRPAKPAFFTGYYEPVLAGSHRKTGSFKWPVYGRPKDLVSVDPALFRREGARFYGWVAGDELVPYASRAEIDNQGLPAGPVLFYTDDPIGAFFLSVQGSGRVRFADGSIERLSFAGTNGRRYTSIGRVLVAMGALDRKSVSLQTIRIWLEQHPANAQSVMESNESFVFYDLEPLHEAALGSAGTEGVPLTPEASVAIDTRVHALGIPMFVETGMPGGLLPGGGGAFERLLIAQDTGGDIKGAARADIFFGSGPKAEWIAGHLQSRGRLFVLLPRTLAGAISPAKDYPDPTE